MVETRAGFWLLLVVQLLAAGIVTIMLLAAPADEQNFNDFFAANVWVTSVLLPGLGILAVTSEWSQRTGLTTFALVPKRERVIGAKIAAAAVAFGLVFLSSPLAIVLYFMLPTVWSILGETIRALDGPAEWLDTARAMEPLLDPGWAWPAPTGRRSRPRLRL